MENCFEHFRKFFHVQPEYIAHDAHPDVYTTQIAESFNLPAIAVQHHHAHIASVMAEHQLDGPVLAWALDGFGYAGKHQAWGGELLLVDGAKVQQCLSFKPYVLPGGDMAALEPWRMASSILVDLDLSNLITEKFSNQIQANNLYQLLEKKLWSFTSSACGRYFDAASALLGICEINTYEAEAAMKLEALAIQPKILKNGWTVKNNQIDFSELWFQLLNTSACEGANLFHGTLAEALAKTAYQQLKSLNLKRLIITGGSAQNRILIEMLLKLLANKNIMIFMPQQLPANDAGLSLGQAWAANAKINERLICV